MHCNFKTLALASLAALTLAQSSGACTYFFVKAKDGSVVSARTDEFYDETGAKLKLVPRGTEFKSAAPQGAVAVSWKTKYGYLSVAGYEKLSLEGLNEKGLATGGLWFGDVKYPEIKPGDSALAMTDTIAWVLGNFATVAEVREGLSKINIWSSPDNPLKIVLPFHFYVTDKSGDSIVVEYIDGAMKIWDNSKNGVMTNEPSLDWQLNNLRFYSNLDPNSHPVPALNDDVWPMGSGMFGLPGDYSTASRFVRVSVLKYFSVQPKDAASAVILARHIMNNVDIPYGPQMWIQGQQGFPQWTIWTVFYDQTNGYFYYNTYDNQTLRRVDMSKLPMTEGNPVRTFDLFGGDGFVDDTARFTGK
jgi:choloylglycine hydrolase